MLLIVETALEDLSENATPASHFDTLARKISLLKEKKTNKTLKTIFIHVSVEPWLVLAKINERNYLFVVKMQ